MYVKKDDGAEFFYKGRVRAGDVVPDAIAMTHTELFEKKERVVELKGETEMAAIVDEAWTEDKVLFPIPHYDELNARNAIDAVEDLEDEDDLERVAVYEAENKNRKTVLRAIEELLEG